MLAAGPDELIQMFPREAIELVVVGGETNGYWRIFGASYAQDGLGRRLALTCSGVFQSQEDLLRKER